MTPGAERPAVWAEHARQAFDRAGHRRGAARDAIVDVLARQSCACTAQQIEDALRAGERPVGRASIYRVLDTLVDNGLVQRLEFGEGTARYETVDPTGEHHHHFVCSSCGRLIPFDDESLEASIHQLSERLEFTVEDHEVVLHGVCDRCRFRNGNQTQSH